MLSKFKKLSGSAGGYSEQGGKCSRSSWPGPVKIAGQPFLHQEIQPVRNCSRKFYFRKLKKKNPCCRSGLPRKFISEAFKLTSKFP